MRHPSSLLYFGTLCYILKCIFRFYISANSSCASLFLSQFSFTIWWICAAFSLVLFRSIYFSRLCLMSSLKKGTL